MTGKNENQVNTQLKRTVRDSFIYLPANVIPAIIGIVLIRILTSVFTQEEYGHYQLTLSAFGLIRVFSMVWLSSSVTRFYLSFKNGKQESSFFTTLFISAILGAIAVALISWGVNLFFLKEKLAPQLFSLINIAILASIFNSFFEIFVMVFRAGLEPKKYSLFWILFAVGKPVLGIGLILLCNFRVDGIFWGFLFVPLLLDIVIFFRLGLPKFLHLSAASFSLFKQFAKYGIPISFSLFAFWMLSLSDRFFIEFFRGSSEVGLYSVGYVISEKTLSFIYLILMLAAYPIIVDNWEKRGDKATQILITEITRYFLLICVPILVVLMVVPEQIFLIFSDKNFIKGAKVLPFISLGVFLNGLTQYVNKGFELHKKSIMIAMLALIAGLSNIGFNLILIPKFGYLGAGFSACLAYIIYFFAAIFFVRNEMSWKPPYRSIVKIAVAAVVFALFLNNATLLISNLFINIFAVIPIGVLIFFCMLILLKEISKDEIFKGLNLIFARLRG